MKRHSAHLFVVAILALLGPLATNSRGDFVLYDNEQFLVNFYHNQGTLYDTSRAFIVSGGSVDECIWAYDSSAVDVSGGSVYILNAYDFSTANISGGGVSYLNAYNSSTVTFHGQNFSASGGLHFDGNRVLGTGILSGEWMDGTPWSVNITSNELTATILAVPESLTPKYSGGTGEPNNPYRIANAEDLNDIGNYEEDWDKHFILVNDVNLAQYTGTQFKIIGRFDYPNNKPFTGVFDGNDHKIWNFTWNSNEIRFVGVFGHVGNGGHIKNLEMKNVNIKTIGEHVGGLVGWNLDGSITNCSSTGNVTGIDRVGGLVGSSTHGLIINCYSKGSVSGSYDVGGLAGTNDGAITNSYSTSSVWGDDELIGGLVGHNYGGAITNCYSTGSVWGGDEFVGGLVGENHDLIINCYSTGNVSGNCPVGGLVGSGGAENSFWDIETSGQLTSAGGTPKTTAEMKIKSTFTDAGWDFIEIWGIGENQTYPYLRTEPAGDSNYDKKVNLEDLAIMSSHWLEGP
jgi:hypothetical protein